MRVCVHTGTVVTHVVHIPELFSDRAVDKDVNGGVDDEEEVVERDRAEEPGRRAKAVPAADHPADHEEFVQV